MRDEELKFGWAVVELMGHQRLAGLVTASDQPFADLRIDIPDFGTRYYGKSAIFGVHPCSEAAARQIAKAGAFERVTERRVVDLGALSNLESVRFLGGVAVHLEPDGKWCATGDGATRLPQEGDTLDDALAAIGIHDCPF